ncbi:FAD/NAD(P)-binding protein [Neomicrococcus lactis]|uniref:FAD-dependent urate hydroxylase HpyO/Asp monooxygenase CreE-like FAD/NAD(P)-binding domain-containing protein n=1 Tax=Neomicrococcus lactis TaxID=732241 RepID=A0A7W8YBJ5_9MICC|nr:FAD/NAD(P)-binding protein [Neomicrococcus lactis]MBB5598481.1 hypothetical protein [Neomicrococcus lactis]
MRKPFRIAVVGAGPRGTSFLDRLAHALAENTPKAGEKAGSPLEIVILEPFEIGPGHVWRTDQSRNFLMNTPAMFPTASPDYSFDQWRLENAPHRADVAALGAGSYPPRALYGEYLRDIAERALAVLNTHPRVQSVTHLHAEVTSLRASGDVYVLEYRDTAPDGTPASGATLADAVVLAVGHVPAKLNPRQQVAGEQAAQLGLMYLPPNVPPDVDWGAIPAGENVLIRGLGLNFFDAVTELTTGRGGRFESLLSSSETGEDDAAARPARGPLRYVPSGQEPRMWAASRRGTPYRAKAAVDAFVPTSVSLKFVTEESIRALASSGVPGESAGKVSFAAHVWPLIHRDVLRTYYCVLAEQRPELFGGTEAAGSFAARLEELLGAQRVHGQKVWLTSVRRHVEQSAPGAGWLDVPRLGHPFDQWGFESDAEYQSAVIAYLDEDAESAERGESDPLKMAIGAMHAARMLVKKMVAEGVFDDVTYQNDILRTFEPLVEGLASGPPVQRIRELAALARAGVVSFIGPEPTFTLDDERGIFSAESPWVDTKPVESRVMLEAMMPANRVAKTDSALLRQLQDDGLAQPRPMLTEDGEFAPGAGFHVTPRPHRLISRDGDVQEGLYVLGLQLSSVQWGTAIAAEAGGDPDGSARTLGDAEAAVQAVLARVR